MDKQKDFEKGFEEWKEKRGDKIAELAKLLCEKRNPNCANCGIRTKECDCYDKSKAILKAGYDDMMEILSDFIIELDKHSFRTYDYQHRNHCHVVAIGTIAKIYEEFLKNGR